jgi:hypothetical protein
MLVGRQRRRTDRARPAAQGVRKRAVENGPAVRASGAFEPLMTLDGLALASLGDRRARGGGESHEEQSGRTGEDDAQAPQTVSDVGAGSYSPR